MHPYLFEVFGYRQSTYGVLVAAGFLLALAITGRLAKRRGADPETITNLGMYCAIAGYVGAKLNMILFDLDAYLKNPGELFSLATLQAAGVFYGGLLLALAFAFWYMRRKQLPALATADLFAPGLALGHAIGRLGCFAAGCCWGTRCDRPWAVTFTDPEAHNLVGVPLHVPLHPSQLYEALAELVLFGFLYWRIGRPHAPGVILAYYLALYGLTRFVVDFFRTQYQPSLFPFTNAQWISLLLIALAAGYGLRMRRRA